MTRETLRATVGGWLGVGLILILIESAHGQTANLKLGNPSDATADANQPDNYLLDRPTFATSYNNAKGTPNWVSWRLSKADLGRAPRDNFEPDADLPATFHRVAPAEYNGSGFDRGHMCPHGDRTATAASSQATFTMTNVIPQSHNLNTRAWETFEDFCRAHAAAGKTCYIICGPAGVGGDGKNGPAQATPDGKVTVPAQCWKVALILDQDVATAADLRAETPFELYAVIMPNSDSAITDNEAAPYATSVHEVEALTGLTFFSAVDPAVLGDAKRREQAVPAFVSAVRARIEDLDPLDREATLRRIARAQTQPMKVLPVLVDPLATSVTPPQPEPPRPPDSPTVAELRQAVAGLTYPSETDEPFTVVDLGKVDGAITDAKLWNLTKQPAGVRVERVALDQFFERLTRTPRRPGSQVDPERAGKFAHLHETLKRTLADPAVYQIGQGEKAIYILGRTKDGHLVGVATTATET